MSTKPEPLLTIAEACGVFNRKPHAFRRAIKAGHAGSADRPG
jgi:hypothetical protein